MVGGLCSVSVGAHSRARFARVACVPEDVGTLPALDRVGPRFHEDVDVVRVEVGRRGLRRVCGGVVAARSISVISTMNSTV